MSRLVLYVSSYQLTVIMKFLFCLECSSAFESVEIGFQRRTAIRKELSDRDAYREVLFTSQSGGSVRTIQFDVIELNCVEIAFADGNESGNHARLINPVCAQRYKME